MKVLAVDYGSKTIGLALGDTSLGLAVPLQSIKNQGDRALLAIVDTLKAYGASAILLGLPLTPSGKEGQRAREVREFYKKLKETLTEDVEIILWDERYTTLEAYSLLQFVSSKKRDSIKDSLAAYALLLEYMESR